jgi:16S rRNA (cytidine1402-2'-O)-methyltransferase
MVKQEAKNGKTILLLVCEGMPSVSDPGLELSRRAREEEIEVTCIPGPSAILAALSLSGIDSNRFLLEPEVFEFKEERIRNFNTVKDYMQTLIYIVNRNSEAARYKDGTLNKNFLVESLEDMVDIFGPKRPAALCFDITMKSELIIRKSLSECLEWARNNINHGLLTIVIEGYRHY